MTKHKGLNIDYGNVTKGFYLVAFYVAGLILGAVLFDKLELCDLISKFISTKDCAFVHTFTQDMITNCSLFIISVLLGLCIIGFPFLSLVPFLYGFCISLRIAYYYSVYNIKGVGYSLLLIIPETVLIILLQFFTIEKSKSLSRELFNSAKNKSSSELNLTDYAKSYAKYGILILLVTAINSLLQFVLNSIIQI